MTEQPAVGMRERILDTAADLFVDRGYEGISMREIAEACQISKPGLYYHYKDKEDLFMAVLDSHLAGFEALLAGLNERAGSPRAALAAFVRAVFTQLPAHHRSVFRLALHDIDKVNPVARADFHRRYQEKFLDPLAAWIELGIARGQIRPIDPRQGVWALLGLMYPFFNTAFAGQAGGADQAAELIETIFFEGVEPRDEAD